MGTQLQTVSTEANEKFPGQIGVRLMLVEATEKPGEEWEKEKVGQLPW